MRHIITVVLAIVLLAACQENSQIVNPDTQFDQVTLEKKNNGKGNNGKDGNPIIKQTKEMQISYSQFLEELIDENGEPVFDEDGNPVIVYNPDRKVRLATTYHWKSGSHEGLRYEATIWIYGRCIDWDSKDKQIKGRKDNRYLQFDIEFAPSKLTADFMPTPFTFASPIEIDLKWKGLAVEDVVAYESGSNFGFIKGNEFEEPTPFRSIEFNAAEGYIKVFGAEVPHFSRYGFLR